jgi:hypothetical protein
MKRTVLVALATLVVTTAVPCQTRAATGAEFRSRASQQSGTLYQASFKKQGLKGWVEHGGGTWQVNHKKGIVAFSGATAGDILAPFSTGQIHDFAVDAKIKVIGSPPHQASGYGVEVRGSGPAAGILGGSFLSVDSSLGERPFTEPMLVWGTNSVGGNLATLHGFADVRIEVHGTDYTLSINGSQIVQFTIPDFSMGTSIGIWSIGQKLQVKSLQVTSLSPAPPLPAAPRVQAVNLGAADVPSALSKTVSHFYTFPDLSRLTGGSPTYGPEGALVLLHGAGYWAPSFPSSGPYDITSIVFAYSSQTTAHDLYTGIVAGGNGGAVSGNSNLTEGDLSGLGDEAHRRIYDSPDPRYGNSTDQATEVDIFFRRGTYVVQLLEDFVQGSASRSDMIDQTTALAKIVDARIQQAGSRQGIREDTRKGR